jgi:hypothetical protein
MATKNQAWEEWEIQLKYSKCSSVEGEWVAWVVWEVWEAWEAWEGWVEEAVNPTTLSVSGDFIIEY